MIPWQQKYGKIPFCLIKNSEEIPVFNSYAFFNAKQLSYQRQSAILQDGGDARATYFTIRALSPPSCEIAY